MKKDKVLAFARRMTAIDIIQAGFCNFGEDSIYDRDQKCRIIDSYPSEDKNNLFDFHLDIGNPEDEDDCWPILVVYFDKNNIARIAEKPFSLSIDNPPIPEMFKGHPAFGFTGTWKEVIDKVIELNQIKRGKILSQA